jgi:hypothetical protein
VDSMTIAEIQGKLSRERLHERSEDLLTADAFGTMYFVSDVTPFLAWLAQAVLVLKPERTLGTILPAQAVAGVKMRFWPRLGNGREPDVAILVEADGDLACLLVIEVKYESGLSNFDPAAPDGDSDDKLTGHQLVDQMAGMNEAGVERLRGEWFGEPISPGKTAWAHVLTTCDRYIPQEAFAEVKIRYGSQQEDYSLAERPLPFWLSWHSLRPVLQRVPGVGNGTDRRLLDHLMALSFLFN